MMPGIRVDIVALDANHPLLASRSGDQCLDTWIFSGDSQLVRDAARAPRRLDLTDSRVSDSQVESEVFYLAQILLGSGALTSHLV